MGGNPQVILAAKSLRANVDFQREIYTVFPISSLLAKRLKGLRRRPPTYWMMVVTVLWLATTLLASPLAEQAIDQEYGPASPPTPTNWTVQNDTDYLGAYRHSSGPVDSITECAWQCMADAKCVATSWNGPHSRQPNRLCNFDCSTARKHRLNGEIAAVITARDTVPVTIAAELQRLQLRFPPRRRPARQHRRYHYTTRPGESMPAHWFTGGSFNSFTGAPSQSPPGVLCGM